MNYPIKERKEMIYKSALMALLVALVAQVVLLATIKMSVGGLLVVILYAVRMSSLGKIDKYKLPEGTKSWTALYVLSIILMFILWNIASFFTFGQLEPVVIYESELMTFYVTWHQLFLPLGLLVVIVIASIVRENIRYKHYNTKTQL